MSIVHIALVGGQTMPVYLAIRESRADEFILLHSSATKMAADTIAADIRSDIDRPVELVRLDPTDCFGVIAKLDELLHRNENNKIEFNISSGTKPWSIAAAMLAEKYKNLELLYVDQSCRLYNYQNSSVKELSSMHIAEIFKFNQTKVQGFAKFSDYTEEDLDLLSDIKKIREKYPEQFNALTIPTKQNKNSFINNRLGNVIDQNTYSEINWDKNKGGRQYVKLYMVARNGSHATFEFTSPHAFDMITSSGWFEYEVANWLSSWKACREVWMNVIFPYNNKNPKNEIDIIVNVGNKLLFVECKTKIFDNTDIDKFTSAVKNYGGLGAKAIFITQENMKAQGIEKCDTNKIAHYSLLDEKRCQRGKKALFNILDAIMSENNVK